MKKIIIFLIILLIPMNVSAYSSSATSTILMDTDNNRIIYANNIHNVRSIASISKIMTCIVAIENGNIDDLVVVDDAIKGSYGSGIYITKGEELTLKDLLYGLMLRSGNDAALMIADYVGRSIDDFVDLMNKKAKEIGMNNTTFNNPSGLDSDKGNYSTAYDMALLTSYAMQNEIYREIVATKVYKLKTNKNTYVWNNKNKLLKTYKYTTGGKTGYTEKAKRTLVTTASKDNVNLVVVTLNDGNDFVDHKELYEEAFSEYKNYVILKEGYIEIIDEKYYSNVKYYIEDSFSYILRDDEKENIILKFELEKIYGYKTGDKIGTVSVIFEDKEIFKTDVFVEIKRKKINVWKKILGWFGA